jgi:DNA-binding XRE family transcriptional regulator
MSRFFIEPITDSTGNKFWVMFEHGMFHSPTAVIDNENMKGIVQSVMGVAFEVSAGNIGEQVRKYRKANRYTQQQMADRAGISRNRLSAIEGGEANITADTLYKLQGAMI